MSARACGRMLKALRRRMRIHTEARAPTDINAAERISVGIDIIARGRRKNASCALLAAMAMIRGTIPCAFANGKCRMKNTAMIMQT